MTSLFAANCHSLPEPIRSRLRLCGGGAVNRLQKFVEKGAYGEGPSRIAYAFGAERPPPADSGRHWERIPDFRPAEELLENGSLKAVFHAAIADGFAVVPGGTDR